MRIYVNFKAYKVRPISERKLAEICLPFQGNHDPNYVDYFDAVEDDNFIVRRDFKNNPVPTIIIGKNSGQMFRVV